MMEPNDSCPIHPPSSLLSSPFHLPFRKRGVPGDVRKKQDAYAPKQGAAVLSTCASDFSVDESPLYSSSPDKCSSSSDLWSVPSLEETDDDCTVSSCSTVTSLSSSGRSSLRGSKGVSFSSTLVTEVWTRPRTLLEDVSGLFYSCEETLRFRQEYRQERKMKSHDLEYSEANNTELDVTNSSLQLVPSSQGHDPNSQLSGTADTSYSSNDEFCNSNHHRISRVVVQHHNTSETYIDQGHLGLLPATLLDSLNETSDHQTSGGVKTASDDFFDKESFWSGQITWY